ncbi:MAG: sigma 54-interacting transcriptional regulator [Desulfobacteraceae bacterium]|jgi:PAS domain S-box-containing protein
MNENNLFPLNDPSIHCRQWLSILDELNIGAFTVNLDHRITAINFCAQALIGLRENEVLQRDCREIFTGVPCLASCMLRDQEAGLEQEPDAETTDASNLTHLITRMATPIFDQAHRVVGCFTILQDHSPIRDLIDRLRYEEQSLKNILDSIDIGIFTVNRGGLITFFNTAAERISGYNRRQVLGQPCHMVFESEHSPDVCLLKESIAKGISQGSHKGRMIDKDGVSIPIRAHYAALRNEKNVIVGGLATFHDLTLVHQLDQAISDRYTFFDMIGKSPAMQKVFEMVPVVAQSTASVLIEGATGTGKDLLAKVIHSVGSRKDRRMVKINCAAIPDTLIESEIFGYVKGAFTGAERDKPGRFQEADGGTIFLDEIGDLPLALQAKLLRVLEDKEFYPLGSRRTRKVDVRIISATNRGLEKLIRERQFREDLFYRLNVVRIELPPLKERRDDLPLMIRHFVRKLCAARGTTAPEISKPAMQILLNHDYPGNVRELENVLEHALIICRKGPIEPDHLPDYLRQPVAANAASARARPEEDLPSEARRILAVLRRHSGHRGQSAHALDMDRTTLWRKIKRYGIDQYDISR